MKTFTTNTMKMTLYALTVSVLILSSCAGKENKNSQTKDSTVTIKKPTMDIHSAIVTNNIEVVKQHIASGSDINEKEPMSKSTPLMTASTFNRKDIAKALIKAGADLTLKNNDGSTALHNAAFFGRVEIVQMLIDAKVDKSIKNNFGATARESVLADFSQMKPIYEMLTAQLQPMGFTLDLTEVEKARPVIAVMLQ